MSKRAWTTLAAVASLIITAGCGGGGGGGGETPPAEGSATKAGAPAAAAPGSGTFGTATIHGKATLDGAAPASTTIKMDADPYCSLQHPGGAQHNAYVVGAGGGLKWVFVYAKEGVTGTYSAPADPVVIDQHGCTYVPHVLGIMPEQTLKILNSDTTLHNIHGLPKNSRPFNLAMPTAGMELTQKFASPEVMVRIKCDVHPWMEAWAGVVSNPFYAVSADDGSFTIERLPAGTYTIEAWHEKSGSQTQSVTVADGETKEITFAFKATA